MGRPGPASIIVSVLLHAGVLGLFLFPWPERKPLPVVSAVPVSIISEDVTVEAAAPDNPSEELITGEEAPLPPPPEPEPEPTPVPPQPTPRPQPERPRPQPQPERTPPPRQQPQPRPPRTTPPAPKKEEAWDPSSVTSGSNRRSNSRQTQAPTGQQGRGQAPRAIGRGDLQALGRQVRPIFNCDLPGASDVTVRVAVTLDTDGMIVGAPRLVQTQSTAAYRAVSDSVIRGLRAAAPFDMPAGYEQQEMTFVFAASTYCN